jgi:hypothetical protein
MAHRAVPEKNETGHRSLDEEAMRVARGMAAFRNDHMDRLCGSSTPPEGQILSGDFLETSHTNRRVGFSPFYYYPFLFAGAFPSVKVEDMRTLALANRILLEAILLADKKIDETLPWTPVDFYLIDSCFHRAFELLLPLFPLEHEFWQKTQEWFLQHGRAIIKEQRLHRHQLGSYTQREFFEISTGKVALIKTNLLAMALLSETPEILPSLMKSQDHFLAGFQCFDDLRDWKQDLQQRNFTFLLTRVILTGRLHARVRRSDPVPRDEVGKVLYHHGIAQEQLRLAERYFQEALDATTNVHVPAWTETVRGFLRHCEMMRHDLAEIRRRTTRKTGPKTIDGRVSDALDFVVRSVHSKGGFPLAQSAYPYLSPSTPLISSRFVAFYLRLALTPFQHMDPRLATLLRLTSELLETPRKVPSRSSLPAVLEESFLPIPMDRAVLFEHDASLDKGVPLKPHGLFWASLFAAASGAGIHLPKLRSLVESSIQQADYVAWTHSHSSTTEHLHSVQGVCHPLLVLLLFCHALGPELPRNGLHDYLLKRRGNRGAGDNATDSALSLLCLLSTGYQGPELRPVVDKLVLSQEADGSWAPNSLYEEANLFHGSRELTTAWCLLALFLYDLGPRLPVTQGNSGEGTEKPSPGPTIVLHSGLPGRLHGFAGSVLETLRHLLPPPWPHALYFGHWPSMPPHFLLDTDQGLVIGVNVLPSRQSSYPSNGRRPLRTEILMAMMLACRCLERGSLKDRLERIFVGGLALSSCRSLWPRQAPWVRLGMPKLEWAWCREHEAFLWEELRHFLLHPSPTKPEFRWLLPDPPESRGSLIPHGASLFLGEALFDDLIKTHEAPGQVKALLGKALPEILRTFRRKVGLDGDENFCEQDPI